MAAVQRLPHSSSSPRGFSDLTKDSSARNLAHFLGRTLSDCLHESRSPSSSKRYTGASDSKSQLHHSNTLLFEMLQKIQNELTNQRAIMLDIQHRISHLERQPETDWPAQHASEATIGALQDHDRSSNRLSTQSDAFNWWESSQNRADVVEIPGSRDYLCASQRSSGLDIWEGSDPLLAKAIEAQEALVETMSLRDSEETMAASLMVQEINRDEEASTHIVNVLGTGPVEDTSIDHSSKTSINEDAASPSNEPTQIERLTRTEPEEKTAVEQLRKVSISEDVSSLSNGAPQGVVSDAAELVKADTPTSAGRAAGPDGGDDARRGPEGLRSAATYEAVITNKKTGKSETIRIHLHRKKDIQHLLRKR